MAFRIWFGYDWNGQQDNYVGRALIQQKKQKWWRWKQKELQIATCQSELWRILVKYTRTHTHTQTRTGYVNVDTRCVCVMFDNSQMRRTIWRNTARKNVQRRWKGGGGGRDDTLRQISLCVCMCARVCMHVCVRWLASKAQHRQMEPNRFNISLRRFVLPRLVSTCLDARFALLQEEDSEEVEVQPDLGMGG